MNERLIAFAHFYLNGQADADGVSGVYIPEAILYTHTSHFITVAGGSVTADIDVQDDGTDVTGAVAIEIGTYGITSLATPQRIAAD